MVHRHGTFAPRACRGQLSRRCRQPFICSSTVIGRSFTTELAEKLNTIGRGPSWAYSHFVRQTAARICHLMESG